MVSVFEDDKELVQTALDQYKEIQQGNLSWVKQHGRRFDLSALVQALQTYIDKHHSWQDDQSEHHWCKVVGGAQRQLPAHVVNEYCRKDRSFYPTPDFIDENLPRTRERYQGEWFVWELGTGLAYTRGTWIQANPTIGGIHTPEQRRLRVSCQKDLASINQLKAVREKQADELPEILSAKLISTQAHTM